MSSNFSGNSSVTDNLVNVFVKVADNYGTYSTLSFKLSQLTEIRTLKELIFQTNASQQNLKPANQIIIFKGKILLDDTTIDTIYHVNMSIVFQLIFKKNYIKAEMRDSQSSYTMDAISYECAKQFLSHNSSSVSSSELSHIIEILQKYESSCFHSVNISNNSTTTQSNINYQQPPPGAPHPNIIYARDVLVRPEPILNNQNIREEIPHVQPQAQLPPINLGNPEWINLRILSRMAVTLILFGSSIPYYHLIALITAMWMYYIYETGILMFLARWSLYAMTQRRPQLQPQLHDVPPLLNADGAPAHAHAHAPINNNNIGGGGEEEARGPQVPEPAAIPAPPPAPLSLTAYLTSLLHRIKQTFIPLLTVPQADGFFYDILSLVICFVYSLFPSWEADGFNPLVQF